MAGRYGVLDSFIQRASRVVERKNSAQTTGDEPLVIDLDSPIQGQHWSVSQLCARGFFAVRTVVSNPIASTGLFLVPNAAPNEVLTDGQNTTFGVNPEARTIAIPSVLVATRAGAGGQFYFTCSMSVASDLWIPTGWHLRFIANVAPGTATPGPGIGSQAFLSALTVEECNAPPATRGHV